MDAHALIAALTTVLAVAGATTLLFRRLRQPVVLGYVLAGLIIGPHVPVPLVADAGTVRALSELGVILLMFALGLEFNLRRLLRIGPTAGVTAVVQCGLMGWIGYTAGQALGWPSTESLFAAAALAVSSTTIIAKAFEEQRVEGRLKDLVVGVLIVEDLLSVLAMAVLAGLGQDGLGGGAALLRAGGRLGLFLAGMLLLGLWLVPRVLRAVLRGGSEESLLVAGVGLCFVAALAAMEAGYSAGLGAFLAGSLVAEVGVGHRLERLVRPLRDLFAAVFFVSVGMLLDPAQVAAHWPAVLLLTALVVAGKVLAVGLGAFLTGHGVRTATQAGLSMAQIGEFSFLIVALGVGLGVVGPRLYPVVVSVSVLTTLSTPWLIRRSGDAAAWVDRKLPRRLQTFASLYAGWSERLSSGGGRWEILGRLRARLRALLLDALAVLAVAAASRAYAAEAHAWLERSLGLGRTGSGLALTAAGFAVCLPFLAGLLRTSRALSVQLAERAFAPPADGALDLAAAPRKAMAAGLHAGSVLFIGLPLLAFVQPLLGGWAAGLLLLLALAALALGVWRQATDLQAHVRAGSELLAEALGRSVHGEAAPALEGAELPGLLPGLGEPRTLQLRPGDPAVGRSLAELGLRGRTGASVLVLIRQGRPLDGPLAARRLLAGDNLVLVGSADAVEAALRLVQIPD